ncbi:hypothetical protein BDQ17DRAFT_1434763 [Cyathus striatus]|nr:hypothetical protein BDQ17DRAFT_1434763 [Cyathus striatus]
MAEEVPSQEKDRVQPDNITINTQLKTLCDRTVHWLVNIFGTLNKPEMIQNAWKLCHIGDLNLSWESLTSMEAQDILHDLYLDDHKFNNELKKIHSSEDLNLTTQDVTVADTDNGFALNQGELVTVKSLTSDSAVPLEAVLGYFESNMQGQDLISNFNVKSEYRVSTEGGLELSANAECALEEVIGKVGHGQRNKKKNTLYSSMTYGEH